MGVLFNHDRGLTPDGAGAAVSGLVAPTQQSPRAPASPVLSSHGRGLTPDMAKGAA
jgi:hypothetical protein